MRFFKRFDLSSMPIKQLLKRYFTYFMVMNLIMTNVVQAFGPSLCVEMMRDEIPQGNGTSAPSLRFMVGRKDISSGHYSSCDFLLERDLDELYNPQGRIADSTFTLEDGRDVEARYRYLGEGLVECALVGMGHESVFVFDLQGNLQIRKLDEGTSYKMNALGSTTLVVGDHKATKITFGEGSSLVQGNLTAGKVSVKGALTSQGVLTTHKMHVSEDGSFINKGSLFEGGQGFSFENEGKVENTSQGTVAVGSMGVTGAGHTENKGVWHAEILTTGTGDFLNDGSLTTDKLSITGSFINKKTFSTHAVEVGGAAQFINQGTVRGRGKGVLLNNQGQVINKEDGHMLSGHLTLKGSGTCLNEGTWHNTHLMCQEGTLLNHASLSAGQIDVASTVVSKGHLTSGKVHIQEKGTFTNEAKVTDRDGAFHLQCDGAFTGTQTSSLISAGNVSVSGAGKVMNLGTWQGNGALIFEVDQGTPDTKFLNDGQMNFGHIQGVLHDLTNAGSMNGIWQLVTHYFANVGQVTGSGILSSTELLTNFGTFQGENIDLRVEKEGVNASTLHVKSLGGQGHFSNHSDVHTNALSISHFHNKNDQGRRGSLVSSHLVVGKDTTFVIDGGTKVSGDSMRVEEGGTFLLQNHGHLDVKRVFLQGRVENKGIMKGESLFWQGSVFHHLEGGSLIYGTGDLYGTVINDGLLKWLGGRLAVFQLENKGSVHFEGVDGLDIHHLINEGASNIGPKSLVHLIKTKKARLRHVVNKDKSGLRLEGDQHTTLEDVENHGKFESEHSHGLHLKTLENHQEVNLVAGTGSHETLTNYGSFFISEAGCHTFHHLVNKGHFQGTNLSHMLFKDLKTWGTFLITGATALHFEDVHVEEGEWGVENFAAHPEKPSLKIGNFFHKKGKTTFKQVASTKIDRLDQYFGSVTFQDLGNLVIDHLGHTNGALTFQKMTTNTIQSFYHHGGTATFRDSGQHAFGLLENKSDLTFIHNNNVQSTTFINEGKTEVSFDNAFASDVSPGLFSASAMTSRKDSTFIMSGGVFSVLACLTVEAQAQVSFDYLRQLYGRAVANTQGIITLKHSKNIHLHEFHQNGGRTTFSDNDGISLAYLRNNKVEGPVQGSVLFNHNTHAFIGRTWGEVLEGGIHNEGALHVQNGDKTRIGQGASSGVLLVENEKDLRVESLTLDQEATFENTPGAVLEEMTNKGTLAFKGMHGAHVKSLKNDGTFEASHTNKIDFEYFANTGKKATFTHVHNVWSKHFELHGPTFLDNVKAWSLAVLNIGSDASFTLKGGEHFHLGVAQFCGKTILEHVQDLRLHHGDVGSDVGHLSLKACAGTLNELINHTTTVFDETPNLSINFCTNRLKNGTTFKGTPPLIHNANVDGSVVMVDTPAFTAPRLGRLLSVAEGSEERIYLWPNLIADQSYLISILPPNIPALIKGNEITVNGPYGFPSSVRFEATTLFQNNNILYSKHPIGAWAPRIINNGHISGHEVKLLFSQEAENNQLVESVSDLTFRGPADAKGIKKVGRLHAGRDLSLGRVDESLVIHNTTDITAGRDLNIDMEHHRLTVNAPLIIPGKARVNALCISNNSQFRSQGDMTLIMPLEMVHGDNPHIQTRSETGTLSIIAGAMIFPYGRVHGGGGLSLLARDTPQMHAPELAEHYKDFIAKIILGRGVKAGPAFGITSDELNHELGNLFMQWRVTFHVPSIPLPTDFFGLSTFDYHGQITTPQHIHEYFMGTGATLSSGGDAILEGNSFHNNFSEIFIGGNLSTSFSNVFDNLSADLNVGGDTKMKGGLFRNSIVPPIDVRLDKHAYCGHTTIRFYRFDPHTLQATSYNGAGHHHQNKMRQTVLQSKASDFHTNGKLDMSEVDVVHNHMGALTAGDVVAKAKDYQNYDVVITFQADLKNRTGRDKWTHGYKETVQTFHAQTYASKNISIEAHNLVASGQMAAQNISCTAGENLSYQAVPCNPDTKALQTHLALESGANEVGRLAIFTLTPAFKGARRDDGTLALKPTNAAAPLEASIAARLKQNPGPLRQDIAYFAGKYVYHADGMTKPVTDEDRQVILMRDDETRSQLANLVAAYGPEKCYQLYDRLAMQVVVRRAYMNAYNRSFMMPGYTLLEEIKIMHDNAWNHEKAEDIGLRLRVLKTSYADVAELPLIAYRLMTYDAFLVASPHIFLPKTLKDDPCLKKLQQGAGAVAEDALTLKGKTGDVSAGFYANNKIEGVFEDTLKAAAKTQHASKPGGSTDKVIPGSGTFETKDTGSIKLEATGGILEENGIKVSSGDVKIGAGKGIVHGTVKEGDTTHESKRRALGGKTEKTTIKTTDVVSHIRGAKGIVVYATKEGVKINFTATGGVLESDNIKFDGVNIVQLKAAVNTTDITINSSSGNHITGKKSLKRHHTHHESVPFVFCGLGGGVTGTLDLGEVDFFSPEGAVLGNALNKGHVKKGYHKCRVDMDHVEEIKQNGNPLVNKVIQQGHHQEILEPVQIKGQNEIVHDELVVEAPKRLIDPEYEACIKAVGGTLVMKEEEFKHWRTQSKSLSPLAMTAIGIGGFFFIMPSAAGWAAMATKAALCCGVAQLSNNLVDFDGDPFKALQRLASFPQLKQMAIAAATAGLCAKLFECFTVANTGKTFEFVAEMKKAVIRAGVNAGVNAAVAGKGLGLATRDALLTGVVSLGAGFLSSQIGKMYSPDNPDGTPNLNKIGYWEHKFMHAGLGGLTAAALGNDIGSGAVGAAVGTMVADAWVDHQIKSSLQTGVAYDENEAFQKGVALAGLVGAVGAYLIGGEPEEGARAAQLAVETNCLPLLFAAASMVWLAIDLYDAYKRGGVNEVANELAKQIAIQIAGGAVMKGVIAAARGLLMSPTSKKIFGKMMDLIEDTPIGKEALGQGKALAGKALDQGAKLMDKFDQSKLGKFLNMLDAKLTDLALLGADRIKALYLPKELLRAEQFKNHLARQMLAKKRGDIIGEDVEAALRRDAELFLKELENKVIPSNHPLMKDDILHVAVRWAKDVHGIKAQGMPFEDCLATMLPASMRLRPGFKVFDFYDEGSKLAISAKTLNTNAATYMEAPSQIYHKLKGYVDKTVNFIECNNGADKILASKIHTRRIELGIPHNVTEQQMVQIERAVAYAQEKGVQFNITKIKGS